VSSSKKWETNVDVENVQESYEGHVAKKVKSDGNKKRLIDAKNSKNKNDISAVMKKEIDMELVAGQKIVSEALKISLLSDPRAMDAKGENCLEEEPAENNLVGIRDARLKERCTKTDSMTVKVEPAKAEAMECLENSSFGSSEMDLSAVKGKSKPKTEKGEATLEDRNTTNDKDLISDRKQKKKIKSGSKYNASNFEGSISNVINEGASAVFHMGKISGLEALPYDTNGENNSKSEVKKMQREQKANVSTSSDFLEEEKHIHSSAAVKERSDMQSKPIHTGKKPKAKSHRDVRDNNFPEGSYGSKEQDSLENKSAFGDPRPKEKPWKFDSEDSDAPGISRKDSSYVKLDKHLATEEQKMHILPPATASTANAAFIHAAPVVIEEHWVCCDICQKWRLLPYEMNPSDLPKKWKCSMLQWL
jgi:hypothetical protein